MPLPPPHSTHPQVNLTGGYYDAGDNIKFGFPMAFSMTVLAYSILEYGSQLSAAGQLNYALTALQWGTDYFIKAHTAPNVLWGQVEALHSFDLKT